MIRFLSIILLIVTTFSATSPPIRSCNPYVQTLFLQAVTGTITFTYPKGFALTPTVIPSFIRFEALSNDTIYTLIISGTSNPTSYTFTLNVGTNTWNIVNTAFLLINSSSEQFTLTLFSTQSGVNTSGLLPNSKDTFFPTIGTFNNSNSLLLVSFICGFIIQNNPNMFQWFNPGFILDYGVLSTPNIWFSIQTVLNTKITQVRLAFLLIDITSGNSKIYRFQRKFVYISNVNTTQTPITPTYYDQYCFMAGVSSFVFNNTYIPELTFTIPALTLTSTSTLYSINITTLSTYAVTCVYPTIYYMVSNNLCYDVCIQPFYPSNLYCLPCHYTCKNCTSPLSCANCLDPFGTTKNLLTDFCNCKPGYFQNSAILCQLCSSSCLNCSITHTNCTACSLGYQVKNNDCVQICGDGRLYVLACDDGNTISGDGCSSSCMIQQNYTCINGTNTVPSVCSYNQPFQLTFVESSQADSNVVNATIRIWPNLPQFKSLDFSQYFSSTLPTNSIAHSYNDPFINLTINFTQPLNSSYKQLTLRFRPPTSSSNNFLWKQSQVVVPYGDQVLVSFLSSFYLKGIFQMILIIVQGLSFLCLVIVYRKATALQFIMLLQIVAVSTSYIQANDVLITSFGYLHKIGINGYNGILNYVSTEIPEQLSLSRFGYSREFFHNLNLMVIVNLGLVFVAFVMYIIKIRVQTPHSERLEKIYFYIIYEIMPALIIFNLVNISFGIGETGHVYISVDSDILAANNQGSNLALFFISLFQFTVLIEYYRIDKTAFQSLKQHYKDTKSARMHFIIWIFYKFIISFIIGLAHKYPDSLIAQIILVAIYIVYVCVLRPFRTVLLLIQHLYSELTLIYLFFVLLLYRINVINERTSQGNIAALLLLALIILGLIFLLIYSGYSLSKTIRYWMRKTPRKKIEHIQSMDKMKEHYEQYNRIQNDHVQTKSKSKSKYKINRLHNPTPDISEITIENF